MPWPCHRFKMVRRDGKPIIIELDGRPLLLSADSDVWVIVNDGDPTTVRLTLLVDELQLIDETADREPAP